MSTTDFTERLANADAMFEAFREMSASLNGAVATLIGEGWTESQARDLVVATFVLNSRPTR
jgi:hypothetical protein